MTEEEEEEQEQEQEHENKHIRPRERALGQKCFLRKNIFKIEKHKWACVLKLLKLNLFIILQTQLSPFFLHWEKQ